MITWVIWKRVISTGNVSCRAEKAAKGFFFHPCCIKTECSPKPLQLMCLALFFFIFQGENALCCCLFVVLVPLSPQGQRHFWPLSICVISALPEPLNIKLPCQRTGGCKKFLGCVISCRNLNNSFSGNSWRGSVQLFCPQLLLLGFSISAVTPVLGLSPFSCFYFKRNYFCCKYISSESEPAAIQKYCQTPPEGKEKHLSQPGTFTWLTSFFFLIKIVI